MPESFKESEVDIPGFESHYGGDLSLVFSNYIGVSALLGRINQVNKYIGFTKKLWKIELRHVKGCNLICMS